MTFEKNGWILLGLLWGAMMFFTMNFAAPWLRGEEAFLSLEIDIPLWTLAGLSWGYFMKRYMIKQAAKKEKAEARVKL